MRGRIAITLALPLAMAAVLFVIGQDFYALEVGARVGHPDHTVLSPSAPVGHGYGIVGSVLLLTNLSYPFRRRLTAADVGALRTWLHRHVLTGLVGGVLILFHSAFQLRSPAAGVAALSLAIVVAGGVLGRSICALVPASEPATLHDQLRALDRDIRGLGGRIHRDLSDLRTPSRPASGSLLAAVRLLPTWRLEYNDRTGVVDRARGWAEASWAPAALPAPVRERLCLVRKLASIPVAAIATAELLRVWLAVHRFTALLMLLSVVVHVAATGTFDFHWLAARWNF